MLTRQKLTVSLVLVALALFTVPAIAGPIVYVVTGSQQFGTVDVGTGAFRQIGPNTPEAEVGGLLPGPNGSLLTLAGSGNLDSINPATGVTTVVGPTGLGDCSTPTSPCGPTSANAFGELAGKIYATDYHNNLYTVNPSTGHATLIGPTGIPAVTFIPLSTPNPDGSLNFFGGALFGASGKLYATFDTGTVNFMTGVITPVIPENLYQIDPATGTTTLIGPTAFALDTVIDVNGTFYAFKNDTNQVVTLNLANGNTSFVSNLDPAAGLVFGASPVPEPASLALAGIGMAALLVLRSRRNYRLLVVGIALSVDMGVASNLRADGPAFTTIDYPGAGSTQPWAINTRGDIAGLYVGTDKATHGFLLSGGQYSAIDFPGAVFTEVNGMNPLGDIAGDYASTLTGTGPHHGFLLSRDGTFTTIDFPDATSTVAIGSNSRGDIVGTYTFADNISHNFLLSGGQFSAIDFPGANYTTATGINPRGDIVGRYTAGGVNHAYLLSGGRFSTIDFPDATYTGATSINQRGDILGRYRNADGVFHGFLMVGFQPACLAAMSPPQVAAVTHSGDFTLVTASKPAMSGEVLSIFAADLGPTRPAVGAGQAFPSSPPVPVDSLVEVRVNGRSAIVFGAVGFPGAMNGYQVNFRVPDNTAKGPASIELSSGSVAGAPVKVMVQ
ncbi:MAG: PEP-CTERM sorting domain-containing protein [Acidobacteriota bacterium]|nr:PEP-CTERM sorting domain-containing protein [Acidobacteriota bacterium]